MNARELLIEPGHRDRHYWRELWRYRELFAVLAWRDIAVRYKQTVIGIVWAVLRPLLTMVVFTIVFGRIAGLPSDGATPYPLLVFAAMLPWTLFASALGDASNSLTANANLIGKVYIPRLIVPAASAIVAFVDFLVGFAVLLLMMAWYGVAPSGNVVFLPLFMLLALAASFGPGLWLTTLNVKYRDFRYVIPFVVQLGLYVSPVGFSSAVIPEPWRFVYSLNPMVGVIDGFRWCLLGGASVMYWPGLMLGALVSALLLWLGLRVFRRNEARFADLF